MCYNSLIDVTTHMCFSIDTKKSIWQNLIVFMTETLNVLVIERNFLNWKRIYKNPQLTWYLVVKDWKLLLKSEKKQEFLFPTLLFVIKLKIQGRTVRQERKWGILIGKREVKLFLLQVTMSYTENLKQSTKNTFRTNKWVLQVYRVKDQYPKNQQYFYNYQ